MFLILTTLHLFLRYSKNRLGYSNDDSAANLRSKRNRSPFYASSELPAFDKSLNFPEMKKLIESYDDTINDLQVSIAMRISLCLHVQVLATYAMRRLRPLFHKC